MPARLQHFQHFGNEDSSIQYFQHFGDQKQFDDESDLDEKVVRRKEYHNQYFTDEIQRVPNKFGSKIGAIYPSKSYGGEGHLFMQSTQSTQRSRPSTPH